MKLITAIIQPYRIDAVRRELKARDINRLTMVDAHGYGRQMGQREHFRGQEYQESILPKVMIQIAVNEPFVKPAVEAIIAGARENGQGQIGDGKIFVTDLGQVVRISDGAEGEKAI